MALAASSCAAAGPGGTREIVIDVTPVEITGSELNGLTLVSAAKLSADHPNFGGFSGLKIDGTQLTAVSDTGWWLQAELRDGPTGLVPIGADYAQMSDDEGHTYRKQDGDAEGLTILQGRIAVSFERDHRIGFRIGDGRIGGEIRDPRFERMTSNKGLEALATTPDGSLLAIAEAPRGAGYPMFLVRPSGEVAASMLPAVSRHFVTGADVGPDGRLYVLLRDYAPLLGISIRIHRYALDDDGFPRPESREVLAKFEGSSGIDNMEGIAVWTDSRGETRLTLISDDNFNLLQRTLLVDFRVLH